jgi:hypothetical protein
MSLLLWLHFLRKKNWHFFLTSFNTDPKNKLGNSSLIGDQYKITLNVVMCYERLIFSHKLSGSNVVPQVLHSRLDIKVVRKDWSQRNRSRKIFGTKREEVFNFAFSNMNGAYSPVCKQCWAEMEVCLWSLRDPKFYYINGTNTVVFSDR